MTQVWPIGDHKKHETRSMEPLHVIHDSDDDDDDDNNTAMLLDSGSACRTR